jgi:hypothetical protein
MCFHKWKIWKSVEGKLSYGVPTVALVLSLIALFCVPNIISSVVAIYIMVFLLASLAYVGACIPVSLCRYDNVTPPFSLPFSSNDATCLKCGKSKFDATKASLNIEARKKITKAEEKIARDNFNKQKEMLNSIAETGEI